MDDEPEIPDFDDRPWDGVDDEWDLPGYAMASLIDYKIGVDVAKRGRDRQTDAR